jgi:hypothetical protein
MRGRVYVGYKKHKQKKTKKLKKQGPNSLLMEVDQFDQFTGEKIGTRFYRVDLEQAYRTRDNLQQMLDDITELIADMEAELAE